MYIKAERVFNYEHVPSSGSGFFVHEDGFVLTNWHVVADQVQGYLWDREREVTAKVLELTVVVDSGSPQERELPATVVARDRAYQVHRQRDAVAAELRERGVVVCSQPEFYFLEGEDLSSTRVQCSSHHRIR